MFPVGSRVRQETLEEGRRKYWPKRYENKDEDNSPKTLNDKKREHIERAFYLQGKFQELNTQKGNV